MCSKVNRGDLQRQGQIRQLFSQLSWDQFPKNNRLCPVNNKFGGILSQAKLADLCLVYNSFKGDV